MGTGGCKVILIDKDLNILFKGFREYRVNLKNTKYLEQDPNEWIKSLIYLAKLFFIENNTISPIDIIGVSVTGQMLTFLPLDKEHNVLRDAILHFDSRAFLEKKIIKNHVGEKNIYKCNGRPLSSQSMICKLLWLKNNEKYLFKKIKWICGTPEFICYFLTNKAGITDLTNASVSGMFNLQKNTWETSLIKEIIGETDFLPEIITRNRVIGKISNKASILTGLLEGTPVILAGGDTPCGALGLGSASINKSYCSIGTTAWVNVISKKPFYDKEMKIVNSLSVNVGKYRILRQINFVGILLKWLNNLLSLDVNINDELKIFYETKKFLNAKKLFFLTQEEYDENTYLPGVFFGLTFSHSKKDILYAVLESISFSLFDLIIYIHKKVELDMETLVFTGGNANNYILMKSISNILSRNIFISKDFFETSALGAGAVAAIEMKLIESFERVENIIINQKKRTNINYQKEFCDYYRKKHEYYKVLYKKLSNIRNNYGGLFNGLK